MPCIICGSIIENPRVGRVTCCPECGKEWARIRNREYRKTPKQIKYKKEYEKKNRKKILKNLRIYNKALKILKNRHIEEFKKIKEDISGDTNES